MSKRKEIDPEILEELKKDVKGKRLSHAYRMQRKYGLDHRVVARVMEEVEQEQIRERSRVASMRWV